MSEELFPSDQFKKQEFNFSKSELNLINTYHTIKTIGELAGILIDNMINGTVLKRIGITPSKSIHTVYDNVNGTFTVYTKLHPEGEKNGQ